MTELQIFGDAVRQGLCPERFSTMWMEAGPKNGASDSQVELPRLAHRFFGAEFDDYGDDHQAIVEVPLTSGRHSWDKRLTWHGNNRMERLNLPTVAKGGFSYCYRILVLQRHAGGFELSTVDPGSREASDLREESADLGTLFLVGEHSKTGRLCGLLP